MHAQEGAALMVVVMTVIHLLPKLSEPRFPHLESHSTTSQGCCEHNREGKTALKGGKVQILTSLLATEMTLDKLPLVPEP